jgi:hypothetical protein
MEYVQLVIDSDFRPSLCLIDHPCRKSAGFHCSFRHTRRSGRDLYDKRPGFYPSTGTDAESMARGHDSPIPASAGRSPMAMEYMDRANALAASFGCLDFPGCRIPALCVCPPTPSGKKKRIGTRQSNSVEQFRSAVRPLRQSGPHFPPSLPVQPLDCCGIMRSLSLSIISADSGLFRSSRRLQKMVRLCLFKRHCGEAPTKSDAKEGFVG